MPGPSKPRKRTKPQPKPRTPKEEAAQEPINGVLVQLAPVDNGNVRIDATPLGAVKATEVPTLLRIAAKNVETALGID